MQNNKLPKDWKWVKMGDVATLSSQKHSPTKIEDLFYIGLEHIEKHTGKLTSKVGLDKITTIKNKFSKGDILYGKLRPNLNKVYLSKEEGVCSTDILVLKLSKECLGKYLHPIMFSTSFVNKMSDNTSGVNLPRVSTKFIMNYEIPLPPLSTQTLIVSKIEELFSELDKGFEDLKTAQQQLKTYRQSVLKYAFEGRLTNKKVKDGELPKGWEWKKISDISKVVRGGSPRPAGDPKYYDGDIPFLKVADLTKDNSIYLTTFKYTIKEAGLHKTRQIAPNTLLLTNSGATLGVPKICMINATMNDGVAAFLDLDERSNHYLYYFWVSKTLELRGINMGAGQPNLNTDLIKDYDLPYCSYEEQHQIVQEIESRLSVADKMEESISQSLLQAEALRQSILKKAFSGDLV